MSTLAYPSPDFPGPPSVAMLGDADFVGCDSTWPDPDVESVLQPDLFHIVRTGRPELAGYLVQLTGVVARPTAEPDYELIREVLTTVRVTPWAQSGQPVGTAS